MVEMIISAVIGAAIVGIVILAIFGGKIFSKKRLSKKANITLEEQKTEALIKAIKTIAKHIGYEYNEAVKALDGFELDEDQLQQLLLNARADKGKVGSDKIVKKAKKIKL